MGLSVKGLGIGLMGEERVGLYLQDCWRRRQLGREDLQCRSGLRRGWREGRRLARLPFVCRSWRSRVGRGLFGLLWGRRRSGGPLEEAWMVSDEGSLVLMWAGHVLPGRKSRRRHEDPLASPMLTWKLGTVKGPSWTQPPPERPQSLVMSANAAGYPSGSSRYSPLPPKPSVGEKSTVS
jgi:hypothetical protein